AGRVHGGGGFLDEGGEAGAIGLVPDALVIEVETGIILRSGERDEIGDVGAAVGRTVDEVAHEIDVVDAGHHRGEGDVMRRRRGYDSRVIGAGDGRDADTVGTKRVPIGVNGVEEVGVRGKLLIADGVGGTDPAAAPVSAGGRAAGAAGSPRAARAAC